MIIYSIPVTHKTHTPFSLTFTARNKFLGQKFCIWPTHLCFWTVGGVAAEIQCLHEENIQAPLIAAAWGLSLRDSATVIDDGFKNVKNWSKFI